ncbi:MAG: hypothetical protein CVU59_09200 [Deltaproteobacteria bacterium HGW-Deltaproteobacteria-17]|nr:MAG: hypothetical protein CVU59_09200 [Deltaproteobacteria bacterium HGW-Deltaproteobacteria-17]
MQRTPGRVGVHQPEGVPALIYLLLFIGIPIAEIYLLVQVAGRIGFGMTLGLVILTGVVGMACVRHQGARVLSRLNQDLQGGRMPTGALTEGVLLLAAGLLLITPGVITDAVGLLLLVPPIRKLVAWALGKHFAKKIRFVQYPGAPDAFGGSGDGVIEGDWEEEDSEK